MNFLNYTQLKCEKQGEKTDKERKSLISMVEIFGVGRKVGNSIKQKIATKLIYTKIPWVN